MTIQALRRGKEVLLLRLMLVLVVRVGEPIVPILEVRDRGVIVVSSSVRLLLLVMVLLLVLVLLLLLLLLWK
jgi:hypothetical protein